MTFQPIIIKGVIKELGNVNNIGIKTVVGYTELVGKDTPLPPMLIKTGLFLKLKEAVANEVEVELHTGIVNMQYSLIAIRVGDKIYGDKITVNPVAAMAVWAFGVPGVIFTLILIGLILVFVAYKIYQNNKNVAEAGKYVSNLPGVILL